MLFKFNDKVAITNIISSFFAGGFSPIIIDDNRNTPYFNAHEKYQRIGKNAKEMYKIIVKNAQKKGEEFSKERMVNETINLFNTL